MRQKIRPLRMRLPPTNKLTCVVTVEWPCLRCGYNLLGLRANARCPECGGAVRLSPRRRDIFDGRIAGGCGRSRSDVADLVGRIERGVGGDAPPCVAPHRVRRCLSVRGVLW